MYYNRELSWLDFNYRVLEEATDSQNPLLERVKFLGIVCSNLDEFYMVRVGAMQEQESDNGGKHDETPVMPRSEVKKVMKAARSQYSQIYDCWKANLLPELKEKGISFLSHSALTLEQEKEVSRYFTTDVFPVLTPMAIDQSRPFPLLLNGSINIGVLLEVKSDVATASADINGPIEELLVAVVQVPGGLPRYIEVPSPQGRTFILLEDLVMSNIHLLFEGYRVVSTTPFRIVRNNDITIAEEGTLDLRKIIELSLRKRRTAAAMRLEVGAGADERLVEYLRSELSFKKGEILFSRGPVDLSFLFKFRDISGFASLRYPDFKPVVPSDYLDGRDMFSLIREKDRLLHHPYNSFQPVVDFVRQAAADPSVLAIKQTLYRVGGDSPIIAALVHAAEMGKQVTVILELMARFDEERNIKWARRLEEAGCHVIYGPRELKVHSKVTLVVRKESDGIRRYLHLGTGNYNEITASVYTDLGVFTCDHQLGADASCLFNILTGFSLHRKWHKLVVAPSHLRQFLEDMISGEINAAQTGQVARIIFKVNSLVDKGIIDQLYSASQAGVQVDLIVRGMCCLVPGIIGLSENISVRSIIGRYLEHSRVFYFYNTGRPLLYAGSADLMTRNLDRRVESVFPIEDVEAKASLIGLLEIMLRDNTKARIMGSDLKYRRAVCTEGEPVNSQEFLQQLAKRNRS